MGIYAHADMSDGADLGEVFDDILTKREDFKESKFKEAKEKAGKILGK